MENTKNNELQAELDKVKLELESEKFKNTYSEELLEKTMTESSDWEEKYATIEKALQALKSQDNDSADSTELAKKLAEKEEQIQLLEVKIQQLNEVGGNSADSDELALAKIKIANLEKQLASGGSSYTSDELAQSKTKINELMLANQQLREESAKSQQGIGEVMLMAKQQAAKMIADAEQEITVNVEKARQEFFDIGNKANTISEEIKTSQDNVNQVYKELLERVSKMSEIDFEI